MWQGDVLANLIGESGKKSWKIAEIGVWKSKTLKKILRAHSDIVSEYWAIDMWLPMVGKGSQRERRTTEEAWNEMHLHICMLMIKWFPQIRIIRATSVEAASLFPKGYFDLVFIDADHHYKPTITDIDAWLPLVKKGGILAGHDYGLPRFAGVTQAVDERFGKTIETAPINVWIKRIRG